MRYSILCVIPITAATLAGCSEGVLDPKGPIAAAEREILFNSLGIMLAIVIPTILATLAVAFWYRSSNRRASPRPDFTYSGRLELLVWSIPAMTVLLVGGVAWIGAHDLDPRKRILSAVSPVRVQVVSLDWKWLFIYPDHGIAAVNQLTIPVGTPVSFELTSSSVMNSFFVPQLAGQIYTMPGMATRLQLQADHPGAYRGLSAQYSGDGFADMRFTVDAVAPETFAPWVDAARRAGPVLDAQSYAELAKPSQAVVPFTYRAVAPDLFAVAVSSRYGAGQSIAGPTPDVTEGRKMNLLGKLSWSAIPFDQPIVMFATGLMVLAIVGVLGWITLKGYWPYLWGEWLASVDHKRIGVMYCVLALIMLLRGFSDAIMMRAQQAVAAGGAQGYLPPEHFDQIFSAHGTIMIFFMAMPFVIGLMNFVVPLQLGVRDMAFPTLNSVALGLTASGILLTNISLAVGEFAKTGWVAYPPLSELQFSPGVGVDYYLWALQISGIGTLLTGINFVTTILKTRAPGMGYMRMPVFCWTALASNLLIVAAFPVLTVTLAMLLLDRYLGFHFFSVDGEGNPMMYVNLFWVWGHPEVYILILPAFGIFSEVVSTFSGKPLFGYRSMVAATMAICVLSFLVWLHHFFTMGASADVNGFFGVMTMIIAVPTGVKSLQLAVHDVRRARPLHRAGAVVDRVHGDLRDRRHDRRADGRASRRFPIAQQPVPGRAFPQRHHWRRRVRGAWQVTLTGSRRRSASRSTNAGAERRSGAGSSASISLSCRSMSLGLMGMTRRMQHYDNLDWQPWLIVAAVGAASFWLGSSARSCSSSCRSATAAAP